MASIPIDLVKSYLKQLIDGAIAEARYVFCFTCIANDFEEGKVGLKVERTTVEQRAKVATDRGDDIQKNVHAWEEKADKLDQEDTKTDKKWFFGFCPNCIWRYRRGKELANKMEIMKKLVETGQDLAIGLPLRLPGVERYSSQFYISFKSRELKHKELFNSLEDDNNYITGLQGMGGIGKTTLAKEVGKALKQSKQFSQVIDTTVSFAPNIKKIQDDIAGPLGLKWEDCNESDRPKKLWKRLTNGEKILLILDDVWGHIDFDDIGIPHSDNHKGCRVLVTSCYLEACDINGCGRTIQLEILSEEDAWIMFKRYAAISSNMSKSLLMKAHSISNEIKGLPVAISVIARSLRGRQHVAEWDEALKSLQKRMFVHGVDDNLSSIYKCLMFSYDNMKDEKAKGLFLLCSVFRKDEEISIEVLTRLAIGVGLLGENYDTYEDARRQVVVAKNKLLDSCLLLETNESSIVKMHNMVRAVAQLIANKEIQAVNLSNRNQQSLIKREKNIKYLLCESKLVDVFSCRFDGSNLEILIADMDTKDSVNIPNSFFENIAGLRVLHLSYQDQPTLQLMKSIESLRNIRSLLFGRVDLGDISILGSLQTLETLDLVWCKIDELPHEITKLEKLKLLSLVFCEVRRNNPFEVIKSCSSLEELYFLHSFNDFCQEITVPQLQRYHVCRSEPIMNESLSKCVAFEGDGNEDSFSEATFKYLMQTAEVLQLSRIEKQWINLMPNIVPIDQGMNDLVEFRLQYDSQLQCLIDTNHIDSQLPNVFSKLVVLHLYEINNLEVLCNGSLSLDSFKSLEELSIECCENLQRLFNCKLDLCNLKTMTMEACPMLVSLFQFSTSLSLVLLEELKIIDCEQLENIIRVEDIGEEIVDGDNDTNSHKSMFPVLKVVDIQACPLLEFIFPFFSAKDLLEQGTINISSCTNLKYIFGQYQDVKTASLKEPQLHDSPNLFGIFPECHRAMSMSMKASSSRDGSKTQIQVVPVKRNRFSWTHVCCYGKKNRHKLMSPPSTEISLVSNEDQLPDLSIALCLKETKDCHISEGSTSGNTVKTNLPNNSQTRVEPHIKLVAPIQKCLKETEDRNIPKCSTSTSQKIVAGTLSTISDTRNEQPIQFVSPTQKCVKRNDEDEGTTSANAKTIVSSTHSESVSSSSVSLATCMRMASLREDGDGQIAISCPIVITEPLTAQDVDVENCQETSKTNNDQVPESKPFRSNSFPLTLTYQAYSMPPEGNPSQVVEDSSSHSLVTRELEQLVSKKHLDYENLSLLTGFLVKHPSVFLRDTSLSNRYKGYAYNSLAELLKFLHTHSVLDVLSSNRSEFVELLQDVRRCDFDKVWLDGLEKRALFHDLQFSQDALQKILESKQQVTKEVEETLLKINIFSQYVDDLKHQLTSSKAVLKSIIQHEEQVLETKAALNTPLGY